MNRKIVAIFSGLALLVAFAIVPAPQQASAGNGAPSGPHYNLNIVGGPGNGSGGASGNVIHVALQGKCKILLTQAPRFDVTDNSCNDGDDAGFQLPAPVSAGSFVYSVWVRAVTPKGSAQMTTCFTDSDAPNNTGTFCNSGELVLNLSKQNSGGKFTDVTRQLTQVCVSDGTNTTLRPIFADNFEEYFWEYLNSGLRLAQFRFYQQPSNQTPGGTCTRNGGL